VMAASTIPVSAEENLGDPIDIRVDIIHPEPVAVVAFPAAAIVRTQAQHGEAIRGWVSILNSKLVQFTVIDTHPQRSIFLYDKQDRKLPMVKNLAL
ncbi:hypothetical protein Tco_0927660, partial [Tanacetum coccineum]